MTDCSSHCRCSWVAGCQREQKELYGVSWVSDGYALKVKESKGWLGWNG